MSEAFEFLLITSKEATDSEKYSLVKNEKDRNFQKILNP